MAWSCGDNLCTSLPLKEEPKSFWNELFSTIPIGNINVSQRNFTWLIKKFQYGALKMGVLFPFRGYDFTTYFYCFLYCISLNTWWIFHFLHFSGHNVYMLVSFRVGKIGYYFQFTLFDPTWKHNHFFFLCYFILYF